jgi:tripartite-type tricarboxylate transporter receptor subunit TctC
MGLFGPARMPPEIVERISRAVEKVLESEAMKAKLAVLGTEPMLMNPAEFTVFVNKEIVKGGALAKAVGLKPI